MSGVGRRKLPVALALCAQIAFVSVALAGQHDELIARHAAANGVPEHLVRRVILIESRGNASAIHAGNYGLMQIRLATARGVGYRGDANGLLDPDTNLTYAVKYLAGAYRAAGCDADRAMSYYQRGYYGAPRSRCASPLPALIEAVAEAESKSAKAALKREQAATVPQPNGGDVMKPKIVRTETIASSSKFDRAAARPVGNFEPARVALPPAPAVALAKPAESETQPTPTKGDSLKVISAAPPAFELASVPLPPVRPDFTPAKPGSKPPHRVEHLQAAIGSRPGAIEPATTGRKGKSDDSAVISFIKKLVTPDPKSVKRKTEAEAEWFPPVQPPE